MTYISAFECEGGIVMCADTQETIDEEKQYSEKLYAPENLSYPIAVGGAGLEEPIEAFSLELFERVEKEKPETAQQLRDVIKSSIEKIFNDDARISAWPESYRTTQCVVAAKPTNDVFSIFKVTGKRVSYRKKEPVIIGYATATNKALMARMYREGLPMQQAVMLAIYLLSQSKTKDNGVGGDPRVVIVRDNGAWIDDPEYLKSSEIQVGKFLRLIDRLFLASVDISKAPSEFRLDLQRFATELVQLRQDYFNESAARSLNRSFFEKGFRGDPYSKVFAGALSEVREE